MAGRRWKIEQVKSSEEEQVRHHEAENDEVAFPKRRNQFEFDLTDNDNDTYALNCLMSRQQTRKLKKTWKE